MTAPQAANANRRALIILAVGLSAALSCCFAVDEDPEHLGESLILPPAFEHLRTLARIASSSSGTSERRSSTSTDAPSRSAVASSAVCTIAPYAITTRSVPSRATRALKSVS